jgi:L,D-peptidoglycan transpeptidase YkuD (ErfK/YbiS/YcfS/YnhG family)
LRLKSRKIVFIFLILTFISCKTPPVPPEAREAELLEDDLRRAGASVYAPDGVFDYQREHRAAKDRLLREKAKFGWFRDYDKVRVEFQDLLAKGRNVLRLARERKDARIRALEQQMSDLRQRIRMVKDVSASINESQEVRKNLAKAEVVFRQAELFVARENYTEAEQQVNTARSHLARSESAVYSLLERYRDADQVEKWRKWVKETIAHSEKTGAVVLVVDKLARKLTLFKKGKPVATYEIGLGRYGLSDKLHAGDDATPEGKYKIIRKFPNTQYYKALLLNYPNEEDLRQFRLAKKNGQVPGRADIGGDIEIHGGGDGNITRGCISVENEAMDKIYAQVEAGTWVTIVGSADLENGVLKIIQKM